MPTYTYIGRDIKSKLVKGNIEADSIWDARRRLKEEGYFITRLAERKEISLRRIKPVGLKLGGYKKVKLNDLVVFSRQFATLVKSGLSLTQILHTLFDQTENKRLKEIITQVINDVEAGETLAEAFGKHPRVFSRLFVSLVRAGEIGGVLDETLEEIANYYEREQDLIQKIKSAVFYPTIVIILAILVIIFFMVYIIPLFERVYESFNAPLPSVTILLINISHFFRNNLLFIILCMVGSIIFYKYFKETKVGKPIVDDIKLRLPLFSKLNWKTSLARFARTLSLLQRAGVPIILSLEMTSKVELNYFVASYIEKMKDGVREGESISSLLQQSVLFPPMLTQMIAVGEETGNLEQMLLSAATFFEREIDYLMRRLTAMIEPFLIVTIGVIVGFIAIALYLPIFNLVGAIR